MEEKKKDALPPKSFLQRKGGNIFQRFIRAVFLNYKIYLLFLPAAIVLFLFNYLPLVGLVSAFKSWSIVDGIWGSPWQKPLFGNFQRLFDDAYFWVVLKNTLVISFTKLLICFPMPIFLALIFYEIKIPKYKRVVQTVLYLPNFLSWVILGGIFRMLLGADGLVNTLFANLGWDKVNFLTDSDTYFWFLIISDIWKNTGFASIMYLASIAAIDTAIYEAAEIDGANRWVVMAKITLPELIPMVVLQLILNVSNVLDGGFSQIENTYCETVYEKADILDTYTYRTSMGEFYQDIELGTALSFFKSIVGLVLVLITNKIADKLSGEGIL